MKTEPPERPAAAPTFISKRLILATRILAACVVALAAMVLPGCGVQGVPHPPRLERPEKIADLTAVQIGHTLELHFTLPQHTTEGERLTKPLEIEILRTMAPEGAGISKLPQPEVWTRLLHDQWLPYAQGNNLSYSLNLTGQEFHDWNGKVLVVAVRTLTRGFRHRPLESDPSNFVDVPVYDVSEPVETLRLTVAEKAIQVAFSPPTRSLSGGPVHDLMGYRIYRSTTGQPGSFEPRGETAAPGFDDNKYEFGKTYYYQVRAVFGRPGRLALSEASPTSKVTPRDVFPPASPQGLAGIYSAGAVELVWTANTETDLAGYNVYRLASGTFQRANKDLLRTPIFRDTTAPPGKSLTYQVTAVDLSGNESPPSHPEVVDTH